ncbi:Protein DEK [Ananas comosus]|uniref:Protein DEK n=1 Tax=Ananas comosus TaxID=4615 RepID=A0A199VMY7_ANACO|nr:Protein DEK [Ananas comosus]
MSEPEPTSAMEETLAANGSGPPAEDINSENLAAKNDADKNEKVQETDKKALSVTDEKKEGIETEGDTVTGKNDNDEKKDVHEVDRETMAVTNDADEKKDGQESEEAALTAKNNGDENKDGQEREAEATTGRNQSDEKKEAHETTAEARTVTNDDDEKKDDQETEANALTGETDGDGKKDRQDTELANIEKEVVQEKTEGKENGIETVEDAEGGKEDKKMEDVDMREAEDVKMVDSTEDVKMVDAEDVKDENKLCEEEGQNEGDVKPEEGVEVKEERDGTHVEKNADESKEERTPKKKRSKSKKSGDRGSQKDRKQSGMKAKEFSSTPTAYSIDRPVRERKTVERLVEVIEKEMNKEFVVEKGRGTPLKDIPSVAYKLARRKPADLKLIHQTLFGRKGKAVDFKSHILQFSGFVWHESDEKQRAKTKEKLDKYVKDTLLDLCDLFNIPVPKTSARKEDLVVKLLDFIAAPHATTDAMLADEQTSKSRKRKRMSKGSASKTVEGLPAKRSRKNLAKGDDTPSADEKRGDETEEEEEEDDGDYHDKGKQPKHLESERKEDESEEAEEDENEDSDSGKVKQHVKKSSKRRGSVGAEKLKVTTSSKKDPILTSTKSPKKSSSSKLSKTEERNDVGERKKKDADVLKKPSTPKPDAKEKKTSGRKTKAIEKEVAAEHSVPTKEELRKTITGILKEVDFNTATFTDILKKLASHYKMDMTPRKAVVKLLIQEELTKLAEAEDNEDDEDEEDEEEE